MEVLLVLFILALTLLVIAGPFIAWAALAKAKKLEQRLLRLERGRAALPSDARGQAAPSGQGTSGEAQRQIPSDARPKPTELGSAGLSTSPQPRGVEASATPPAAAAGSEDYGRIPDLPASEGVAPATTTSVDQKASDHRLATQSGPRVEPPSVPKLEWEQWVGIRGAAVVGGLLLALAGLLFFQHALQQGWLDEKVRLAIGASVGTLALVAAEFFRKRQYNYAPAAACGAGIVVLYATTWASYELYGITPAALALPSMALITALCVWLSMRFESQLVAVLGLVGGFATPLVLSISADHPLGLFGYLLLLDLGLLAVGRRMNWAAMAVLGVLGTHGVLWSWVLLKGQSDYYPELLISMGVASLLFVAMAPMAKPATQSKGPGSKQELATWLLSQAGALVLPIGIALYFASTADLGKQLWPIASFLAMLLVASHWVARDRQALGLPLAIAAGLCAFLGIWLVRAKLDQPNLWEYSAWVVGLLVISGLVERYLKRPEANSIIPGTGILAIGLGGLGVIACTQYLERAPAPLWLAILVPPIALHLHHRSWLRLVPAICCVFAINVFFVKHGFHEDLRAWHNALWLLAAPILFVGLAIHSTSREDSDSAAWAWRVAALAPLGLIAGSDVWLGHRLDTTKSWQAFLMLGAFDGLVALGAWSRLRTPEPAGSGLRGIASRWLFACTALLLCASLAMGLEEFVVAIFFSVSALTLAILWRWLPHQALRSLAGALMLCGALEVLRQVFLTLARREVFPNGDVVVWNWTSYGTLIPFACSMGCSWLLCADSSRPLPTAWRALGGVVSTLLAFIWLNLQVLTYYEREAFLSFNLGDVPQVDLALSITWTLFSLALLALGMWRGLSALRQLSLVFLLITLGKVFLHDLGDVQGLYRVGSIVGLAISLLLVSLVYQRWVFPKKSRTPGTEESSKADLPPHS